MELRERNYRSRLGSRRGTKARREAAEDEGDRSTSRSKFSITHRDEYERVDYTRIVKKWAPYVIAAAIAWWAISNYVL